MIKTILIDPYGQTVSQLYLRPTFLAIDDLIGDGWYVNKPIVLDNGDLLYREYAPDEVCNYRSTFRDEELAGYALIARLDSYGDLMDCRTDLGVVRPQVEWL